MKKIILVFLVSIVIIVLGVFFLLYSPAPTNYVLNQTIVFNEDYFLSRLLDEGVSVFKTNEFVITEEELNGFVNYKLSTENQMFENPYNLHLEHISVELLENQFRLNLYALYGNFPFRVQTALIPAFQDSSFSFSIHNFALSRIKLPNHLIENQLDNMNMASLLQIPVSSPESITIKDIRFGSNSITIVYDVNNLHIIDQLIKRILCSNK
ncbi:MAG: hypothetical protein ACLKAK_06140 [Alkaliphilus sp.]